MTKLMIRNTLIFLLFSNIVFGQNLNDTKINVSKKYSPSVTDANRLDDQAVYLDTIKIKNTFDYDFISMQIKTKPNIRPLKPALVKNQKFMYNNLNKIELSLGNKFYSDAYLNFSKKIREKLFFGIASSNNRMRYKIIDDTNIKKNNFFFNAFANSEIKKNDITANFHFFSSMNTTDESITNANNEKSKFNFNHAVFDVKVKDKILSRKSISHITSFSYESLFSEINKYEPDENILKFESQLSTKIYQLDSYIDMTLDDYRFGKYSSSNELAISFTPSVDAEIFSFDVNFGIGFEYFQNEKIFDVFPIIEISKVLVPKISEVSFGTKNDYQRNYLINNYLINPLLDIDHTHIKNSESKLIYLEFFNKLSKGQFINIYSDFGYYQNFMNYENIVTAPNTFEYNYTNLWQSSSTIKYSNMINHFTKLNFDLSYQYRTIQNLSNISDVQANLYSEINLKNKIIVSPIINYQSPKKSFIGNSEYELEEIMNINIHSYYSLNNQIDFNIKLNNILNSKKEVFRNIKQIGFNMSLGFNYKF